MKKIIINKKILIIGLIVLTIMVVAFAVYNLISKNNEAISNAPIDIGNPQKGDFVLVGKMSIQRHNHQTILLDDGNVLLFGGQGEDSWVADLYDPSTKKFTRVGRMFIKRGYATPINLHNGKVLIIGGSDGYPQKGTQFYNIATKEFEIGPDLNYPRGDATATQLMDGHILVTGGQGGFIKSELYNPKIGKFKIRAKMKVPRFDHSAILLKDGRVLIVGGVGKNGKLSSAEVYDPKMNNFKLVGNMNIARKNANLYLLKDGNVLISGGIKDQDKDKGMDSIYVREIEIYNPKTNKFTIIAKRTSGANSPAEVLLNDDKLLFTGSQTGVGLSLKWYATSEIFDPKTREFTQGEDMKYFRSCNRATLLEDGNVLISGSDGNGTIAELYISK